MANVPVPADLSESGAFFWREMTGKYEFSPHELRILESAARTSDLIDRVSERIAADDVMVIGSQGQEVMHPLLSEVGRQRNTFAGLLAKLKLPDDAGEAPRSVGARKAASARWSKTG